MVQQNRKWFWLKRTERGTVSETAFKEETGAEKPVDDGLVTMATRGGDAPMEVEEMDGY